MGLKFYSGPQTLFARYGEEFETHLMFTDSLFVSLEKGCQAYAKNVEFGRAGVIPFPGNAAAMKEDVNDISKQMELDTALRIQKLIGRYVIAIAT